MIAPLHDQPRKILCDLIAAQGKDLCHEPGRCRAFLLDLCGRYKAETNLLTTALEERIAADLLARTTITPSAVLLARLTKRLCDERNLTEVAARWAVESWALALGVITPSGLGAAAAPGGQAVSAPVSQAVPPTSPAPISAVVAKAAGSPWFKRALLPALGVVSFVGALSFARWGKDDVPPQQQGGAGQGGMNVIVVADAGRPRDVAGPVDVARKDAADTRAPMPTDAGSKDARRPRDARKVPPPRRDAAAPPGPGPNEDDDADKVSPPGDLDQKLRAGLRGTWTLRWTARKSGSIGTFQNEAQLVMRGWSGKMTATWLSPSKQTTDEVPVSLNIGNDGSYFLLADANKRYDEFLPAKRLELRLSARGGVEVTEICDSAAHCTQVAVPLSF